MTALSSRSAIVTAIKEARRAIRYHRDQKGDDRCWLDDQRVWGILGNIPVSQELPRFEEAMKRCRLFWTMRNAETPDLISSDAILDERQWDADLNRMSEGDLRRELERLRQAIRLHWNVARLRLLTARDDRTLYAVLPEKIPADFRLPSEDEFLGNALAPNAGCPSFFLSHAHCGPTHNTHVWGPCGKN